MDNNSPATSQHLQEHARKKEILSSQSCKLLEHIEKSSSVDLIVDLISSKDKKLGCTLLDSLNSKIQLLLYFTLKERAQNPNHERSEESQSIINFAKELNLSVTDRFANLCKKLLSRCIDHDSKLAEDVYEMVANISQQGNDVCHHTISSLDDEEQLCVYWLLQQHAGKENDLSSKICTIIIENAEKKNMPVVQAFSMLCDEIPAVKAKALVS
jgi:uncharacterized protein YrzB (UPF0473 family)